MEDDKQKLAMDKISIEAIINMDCFLAVKLINFIKGMTTFM